LVRDFIRYVARHMHIRKSRRFLTFNGHELNLAIWLLVFLLAITCVLITQMGHASPFYTFKVQMLSNGIKNSSIQWVLTLEIIFWRFESPSGLQFPKWELIWECRGSFLDTFPHSWEHEMWLPGFILGPHLCKPLFL
jgi:hypothetical protein